MGQLAQWVRRQFAGKVIAVAGSNGKTGTKRLIDAALNTTLRGTISPKSFNNDIGVPLSIFAAGENDDYLVVEIGTNHHGEIAVLTEIARPDIAVITNCSAEHLEGLSDLDGVRRENASIVAGMPTDGLLIVNGDDTDLMEAIEQWRGECVTFGFSEGNDLFAADVGCDASGTRFSLNGEKEVFIPLLGRHTAVNALAAIAVGQRMGVTEDQIIAGLSQATGPEMRLELKMLGGVNLLNDAYNANPASMRAALETLCALPASGRRVAVLGDMRELGVWTERFHREIGATAARCRLDKLVCVGDSAALIGQAAQAAGMNGDLVSFHGDANAAASDLAGWVRSGDLVLLKGSRAIGLEKVAEKLSTNPDPEKHDLSAR
jgi:UDP-N-acetylmuramoyl-tripeptide--D-alanyl-D-alanine ligase